MSHTILYTIRMNNAILKQNNSTHPLFTVQVTSASNKQCSWDFVLNKENTLVFAGKTIVQRKASAKDVFKASLLQIKPDFIIETGTTFPNNHYVYMPKQFSVQSYVEARYCAKRPPQKILSWLSCIAPLLLALELKDSLLAAEIFHRHSKIFMSFPVLTMKLLESISVEGLFSWIWGRFDETAMSDLQLIFEGKCTKKFEQWGVAEAFFTSARRRLCIENKKNESIDDCMAHYLKTHPGTKLTIGIVGSTHYRWVEKTLYHNQKNNSNNKEIFSKTKSVLKADSNNSHDSNAIALYLGDSISGYIRKTGAATLRKALPSKQIFSSRLTRLGYTNGSPTGIVVEFLV